MSGNDIILFVVIFASVGVAVLFPEIGYIFRPFILYFMMLLLFFSFLKIDFSAFLDISVRSLRRLSFLISVKLIVLPTILYFVSLSILPDFAVPVLLISGISTGVVAPFIATLLKAEIESVLRMVVSTSLLVPFSLPCLVKILAGEEITIPLETMTRLLAMVIFIPVAAVYIVRKHFPSVIDKIQTCQYPISLLTFSVINLGVFSTYSSFFFQNPWEVILSIFICYILSVIYYVTGFLITFRRRTSERIAAGVSLAIMNNVLVIVFSSQFFGPLAPTLAAMYMFPFFTMIVPVKLLMKHTNLLAD